MATDYIRYDILTQEALRGVVRTVLTDAATNGLPGEHHFFINIDTRADGVKLSPRLMAQYPEEMTIVLQHQFWDLTVHDDVFEVGLSFNGIPERLVVPLAAIKGFFDPSVQFGLQFAVEAELKDEEQEELPDETPSAAPQPKAGKERPPARHKRSTPRTNGEPAPDAGDATAEAETGEPSEKPQGGAEVVRLDRFRKK